MTIHDFIYAGVRLAWIAFIVWVGLGVALWAGQRHLLYPTFVKPVVVWHEDGVERVALTTSDGAVIKAFWVAPRLAGGPFLITFMGNGSDPEAHAHRFHGHPDLTVDFHHPSKSGSVSLAKLLPR